MQPIALKDVLDKIRCEHEVIGDLDVAVDRPSPISTADGSSITFCSKGGDNGRMMLEATSGRIVITGREHAEACRTLDGRTFIIVDDPRLAFARVVEAFFTPRQPEGISDSALVSATARVGDRTYIGPLCDVRDGVVIGDGCRLEGSVTVHEGSRIGKNVIIRAGAVIGTDGFGYNRTDTGRLEKFPQIGGVVIADDVEIGSNVCVARGTMDDTVIGRGTKIDNLVQVAHNVRIGEDCLITSMVWLGGSARIGDRCWLSPMVTVLNGISLGDDVMVAMGSSVIKDIPSGEYWAGNPARPTIRKR